MEKSQIEIGKVYRVNNPKYSIHDKIVEVERLNDFVIVLVAHESNSQFLMVDRWRIRASELEKIGNTVEPGTREKQKDVDSGAHGKLASNIQLRALCLDDMELVRQWRNGCLESLRTPFLFTREMQETFYRDVVCSRKADARYWGIWTDCGDLQPEKQCLHLIGMGGLENIQRENSNAEISLILAPEYRGKGMAEQAVELLLHEAFQNMNLKTVYGEVYRCNNAGVAFWEKIAAKYTADKTELPNRKFWGGMYWNSFYFSIDRTISASHIGGERP